MTRTLVWPDGTVYTIIRSSRDTAGAELEMEWTLPARGWAPQPHVHPSLTEEYEVLEGSLDRSHRPRVAAAGAGRPRRGATRDRPHLPRRTGPRAGSQRAPAGARL